MLYEISELSVLTKTICEQQFKTILAQVDFSVELQLTLGEVEWCDNNKCLCATTF